MVAIPVRLMTFNLRFDNPADVPAGNGWADRLDSVVETIVVGDPDVIGAQEAIASQLADLEQRLPGYSALGQPRVAGPRGEYVPLLVRTARFDVAACGDFWLSLTPDTQGSVGWDADNPRHCTWAVLDDRSTGDRFAVFNTHLDNRGALARLEGARLISAKRVLAGDLPYAVMGDLNATEESEPLGLLRATGLVDAYRAVHPVGHATTLHLYGAITDGPRIDFILCDPRWKVLDARIVRELAAGRLPSDHYPVIADVQLTGG